MSGERMNVADTACVVPCSPLAFARGVRRPEDRADPCPPPAPLPSSALSAGGSDWSAARRSGVMLVGWIKPLDNVQGTALAVACGEDLPRRGGISRGGRGGGEAAEGDARVGRCASCSGRSSGSEMRRQVSGRRMRLRACALRRPRLRDASLSFLPSEACDDRRTAPIRASPPPPPPPLCALSGRSMTLAQSGSRSRVASRITASRLHRIAAPGTSGRCGGFW